MKTTKIVSAAVFAVLVANGGGQTFAQQRTFHLDRLEMPGAPDDGVVLYRPVSSAKPRFFGQLGLGYSLHPLRTKSITSDRTALNRSASSVISYQLTQYTTFGFQFLDRYTLSASLPITWAQDGQNPDYGTSNILGSTRTSTVSTAGPAVADTRLDLRGVIVRSEDRSAALGAHASIFFPTGNGSSTNFGGDGQLTSLVALSGEWTWRSITFVGNTGLHFRPVNSINDPVRGSGLGVGNEWRWAVGAFLPLRDGKFRVGATIFGQTGIEGNTDIVGDNTFTTRNTPVEWNLEGRMKFGPEGRWWAGASGGSFLVQGYGAPDLRLTALVGTYVPILDSDPNSPSPRDLQRQKWRQEHSGDADHDGIPDDVDACPSEAEDHKGAEPSDGCPLPPDRDGDGIPDHLDKCPDQLEDYDGIEDGDGCPEDDYDSDGVPDAQDACPKAPGRPSSDPKTNGCPVSVEFDGNVIRIKQQVHFKTGSAEILPDSFPMLQEIADVLRANKGIKRLSVDGHTDNRGGAEMNRKLSQARAESVMRWLVDHAIEASRLEAHGYGLSKPIETNDTEAGRAANRRVEFRIVEQVDGNKPEAPSTPPSE